MDIANPVTTTLPSLPETRIRQAKLHYSETDWRAAGFGAVESVLILENHTWRYSIEQLEINCAFIGYIKEEMTKGPFGTRVYIVQAMSGTPETEDPGPAITVREQNLYTHQLNTSTINPRTPVLTIPWQEVRAAVENYYPHTEPFGVDLGGP